MRRYYRTQLPHRANSLPKAHSEIMSLGKKLQRIKIPLISIVDDDRSVVEATVNLLQSMGFRARGFLSAEQFLSSHQMRQTSCLILDVRMPGIGGFELGRRLAAEGRRIPIIFMTAHGGDDASNQAFQAGAVAFLIKPFSQESLVQALSSALAKPP
jgi:FixJ family two-component response regulator